LDEIARQQQDLRSAFTPGEAPVRGDVARPAQSRFTLDPLWAGAPTDSYFLGTDERGRQTYSRDGVFHVRDNTMVDRSNQSGSRLQ